MVFITSSNISDRYYPENYVNKIFEFVEVQMEVSEQEIKFEAELKSDDKCIKYYDPDIGYYDHFDVGVINGTKKKVCETPPEQFPYDTSSKSANNIKAFKCNECNKNYSRNDHLKRHQLLHIDRKPFECPLCNQRFSRADHVKRHLSIHSGDKPHKCDLCQKAFGRPEHLRRHMAIHSETKLYQCSVCKKGFNRADALNKHRASNSCHYNAS